MNIRTRNINFNPTNLFTIVDFFTSISIFFNNLFNQANKKIASKINDKSYWKMFETYLMAYRLENAIELYNSHCKHFTLAHKARGFVLLHFSNYRKKSCERWRMRKI